MMALATPTVEEQYEAAFRRWGLEINTAADAAVVARLREQPEPVVQELIGGLDAWMLHRRGQRSPRSDWRRLYRLVEQLDQSAQRRKLRSLLVEESAGRVEIVAGLPARVHTLRRLQTVRSEMHPARDPVLTIVLLAQASNEAGDAAGAERLLREAIAARPDQVVLLNELGNLLERQGASRRAEAIERYSAARAVRPRLGITLTRAMIAAGRALEGEAVMRDLVRQQPDNPEMHLYLGNALHDQKKLAEAIAAYREAIRLKHDYPEVHYNLGIALWHQGKLPEAVAANREAIRLSPDDPKGHNGLGVALYAQGKLPEAAAAYREALRVKPDYPWPRYNLGLLLREHANLPAAVAA
jgi:predicted Zn-dependent protease